MKKLLLMLVLALPMLMTAQQTTQQVSGESVMGKIKFSAGVAGPNTTKATLSGVSALTGLNLGDQSSTPFFIGSATYGISEVIEAGAYFGYHKSTSNVSQAASLIGGLLGNYTVNGKSSFTVTTIGAKFAIHS